MTYIEAAVSAVPNANRAVYEEFSRQTGAIFKDHGLLTLIECWGEDVPEGDLTSFPLAVKLQDGESVVLSWMVWPDKATRDEGWRTIMDDPRMEALGQMPFDGKRMIFGGFEPIVEL
jgi:uncharacterized protein YbaA (DUF1428 family)